MRKPNLKNLKIDLVQTKKIKESMALKKSVKITINIDADTLSKLKEMADESGIPYQRLINRTLKENIDGKSFAESRLKKIENELKILRKKLTA